MATMSPPIVAGLARELERILPTVLATTSRKDQPESIRLLEVDAKLASLLEELKQQGRANMATMSPAAVFMIAGQIENLLDEWEGSPHGGTTRHAASDGQGTRRQMTRSRASGTRGAAAGPG